MNQEVNVLSKTKSVDNSEWLLRKEYYLAQEKKGIKVIDPTQFGYKCIRGFGVLMIVAAVALAVASAILISQQGTLDFLSHTSSYVKDLVKLSIVDLLGGTFWACLGHKLLDWHENALLEVPKNGEIIDELGPSLNYLIKNDKDRKYAIEITFDGDDQTIRRWTQELQRQIEEPEESKEKSDDILNHQKQPKHTVSHQLGGLILVEEVFEGKKPEKIYIPTDKNYIPTE